MKHIITTTLLLLLAILLPTHALAHDFEVDGIYYNINGTTATATCLVTVYTEPCDVNCDGFITIGDATQMIDYLLGGAVDNFKVANADVNGDGQISIGDVTILIDQLLSANN